MLSFDTALAARSETKFVGSELGLYLCIYSKQKLEREAWG